MTAQDPANSMPEEAPMDTTTFTVTATDGTPLHVFRWLA
jgi:hypothetical protein